MSDVAIIGIGMHPFGRTAGVSGLEQGVAAIRAALQDAGLEWRDIQIAYGGSDASGNADTLVNQLGLTGLPFINVRNGCATGGSALSSLCSAIQSGKYDLGVAVGFDKHEPGAFNPDPVDWGLDAWYGQAGLMLTTQFFALKIQRYMAEFGISESSLAKVAEKAFSNGALNPNAWRRTPLSEQQILESAMVNDPLRKYMFCSPSEGAVALVLASRKRAKQLAARAVFVRAIVLRTREYGSFEVFSPSISAERAPGPTVQASAAAFEAAGIGPADIGLAQLQDTESGAEIIHMAENGFCSDGEQESLIQEGVTRIGGRLPINTDGGCLANGEPIGASGLRQVYENCLQLRGDAGNRQVRGERLAAYTHVYGAPGVSAVTILTR